MTFRELMGELSRRLDMEVTDEGGAAAVEIDGLVIFMVGANDDLILFHADGQERFPILFLPLSVQRDNAGQHGDPAVQAFGTVLRQFLSDL